MSLTRKLDALYDATLALLYPLACAVCGVASVDARADAPACAACWEAARVFTEADALCWKCGALAQGDVRAEVRADEVFCRRCDAEPFASARACGLYAGALRASVLALKREPRVGARLASLLDETRRRSPLARASVVMSVPLHPERERERGFNQSNLLARAVARFARLPLDEWSLERAVHTERSRAGMDRRARRESVEGAFRVVRPRLVAGERVLLVDDVYTTGATVAACADALLAAGAREVHVLTVAKA